MSESNQCPCGSEKDYSECCEIFHQGDKSAPTALTLMRARYCAFVKGCIPFIMSTHQPEDQKTQEESEISTWAKESTWLGLEILNTVDGLENDMKGSVEFIANYKMKGQKHSHHEISEFKKIDGAWYFCEGKVLQNSVKREGPKIGRNEPCPCGSGKKYKKCCL